MICRAAIRLTTTLATDCNIDPDAAHLKTLLSLSVHVRALWQFADGPCLLFEECLRSEHVCSRAHDYGTMSPLFSAKTEKSSKQFSCSLFAGGLRHLILEYKSQASIQRSTNTGLVGFTFKDMMVD
jgi:hypothetical protein